MSNHIRWMIRLDCPQMLAIESLSFDYPWTEDDFCFCLRQRNCIGQVIETGNCINGFMLYELHKSKLHILNLAVHPDVRRQGIGRAMIEKMISKLSSHRRSEISVELRESNTAAQLFFRACGFRAVRVIREFYPDTGEDAYLMQYRYPSLAAIEEETAVAK